MVGKGFVYFDLGDQTGVRVGDLGRSREDSGRK